MSVTFSKAINSESELGPLIQRAYQKLVDVIGPTAESVSAEWDIERDAKDRPVIRLDLSDFTKAHARARFAPDELADERRLSDRLYKIWGDLLQDRSHQQLNHLSGKVNVPGQ
jgi:hypothetical protein